MEASVKTEAPTVLAHLGWPRFRLAETDASDHASAACYRRTNVDVLTVVVPELNLRDVERHIFAANLVESADHTALEDAPKAFNRVGVDCANHIFATVVANDPVGIFFAELSITTMIVSGDQTDFVGNRFLNEIFERRRVRSLDHAGDNTATTLDGADYSRLARCWPAGASVVAFITMFVASLSAHISFVHLDMPISFLNSLSCKAARMRWHMYHAVL